MPSKKEASKELVEKLSDQLHECGLDSSGTSNNFCDGSVSSCPTREPKKLDETRKTKRPPPLSYSDLDLSESESTSGMSQTDTGSSSGEDTKQHSRGCTSSDSSEDSASDSDSSSSSHFGSSSSRSSNTSSSTTESSCCSSSGSYSYSFSETLSNESEEDRMDKFSTTVCIDSASSTDELSSLRVSPSRKKTSKDISNNNGKLNSGVYTNLRSSAVNGSGRTSPLRHSNHSRHTSTFYQSD